MQLEQRRRDALGRRTPPRRARPAASGASWNIGIEPREQEPRLERERARRRSARRGPPARAPRGALAQAGGSAGQRSSAWRGAIAQRRKHLARSSGSSVATGRSQQVEERVRRSGARVLDLIEQRGDEVERGAHARMALEPQRHVEVVLGRVEAHPRQHARGRRAGLR